MTLDDSLELGMALGSGGATTVFTLLNLWHANIAGVTQYAKNRQKPDDNANHYDHIENLLDLTVHRDVGVYQPKQHANDNQRYDERN